MKKQLLFSKKFWGMALFCYFSVASPVSAVSILDIRSDMCVQNCGRLVLGAAKIQPNVIQWVGAQSTQSMIITESSRSFGFTGESSYKEDPVLANRWSYELTGSAAIGAPAPGGAAPSMGYFFAPENEGVVNASPKIQALQSGQSPAVVAPAIRGEGVLDGDGATQPALTLDITADGLSSTQACTGLEQCEMGQLSQATTFTVTPRVNTGLLPAGVEPVTHMLVELLTEEVNTGCTSGNTALLTRGLTSNSFVTDNYFHYLDGSGPSTAPRNCIHVFPFLVSVDKPFSFQVSRQRGTGNGYADYTFFVRGHYDRNDATKWQGSRKTYRLSTSDQVTVNQRPTASFTATPSSSTSLNVNLNASASFDPDGVISSYSWSTNAGSFIPTGVNSQVTFARAGTYTVTLTVVDNGGMSSIRQQSITVPSAPTVTAPVASFTMTPSSGNSPLNVQFNAGNSTPSPSARQIVGYKWTSSDGTPISSTSQPSATFRQVGQPTITLVVTDELGHKGTTSQSLTVTQGTVDPVDSPIADFTYTWLTPTRVQLDASNSLAPTGRVIEEYQWDTSDSQHIQTVDAITEIEFPSIGVYTVTLTVRDDEKDIGVKGQKIEVLSRTPPIAAFTLTPTEAEGFAVLTVDVNASGVSYDPDNSGAADGIGIVHYAWSWSGNGESGAMPSGTTSSVKFETAGTYTIELKVVDDEGVTALSSATVIVKNRALPTLGKGVLLSNTGAFSVMDNADVFGGVQRVSTGEFVATNSDILTTEEVDIIGTINVPEQHQGQVADVVAVFEYTGANDQVQLLMRTADSSFYKPFETWDFDVAKLNALNPSVALPASLSVPVYKGRFDNGVGNYRLFIGYRLESGDVLFNGDTYFNVK